MIIQTFRMLEVHRTHQAKICNHAQVADSLDSHGWSASKLWNVANYHSRQQWEATGEIPDHSDLKTELKTHNNSKGLHSQSSQRVLEELAEAFNSCTARGSLTVERIRPATAKKTTTTNRVAASTKNTLVQQSRGSRTASNMTPRTTAFDSQKARITNNTRKRGNTSLLSTKPHPVSPSRTSNRFEQSTIGRNSGGNFTSSASTRSNLPTHPAPRQRGLTSVSVTSPLLRTAPRKPTSTPAIA